MPKMVNVPVLGQVPRGALIAGGGAAVVVAGYLYYRHKQNAVSAAYGYGQSTAGYGASAYGYGQFYGYGPYGGSSGVQPYPTGAEYGYGAYGYGYYNPYTGQWIGPTQQQPPTPTPTKSGPASGYVTVGGKRYWYSANKQTLGAWIGKGKKRKYEHVKV